MFDKYPIENWRYEVANGDTVLGFAEWIEHKKEAAQFCLDPQEEESEHVSD